CSLSRRDIAIVGLSLAVRVGKPGEVRARRRPDRIGNDGERVAQRRKTIGLYSREEQGISRLENHRHGIPDRGDAEQLERLRGLLVALVTASQVETLRQKLALARRPDVELDGEAEEGKDVCARLLWSCRSEALIHVVAILLGDRIEAADKEQILIGW